MSLYQTFFEHGAVWFTIPAVVGTGFFLLQIVLLMTGLGGDAGLDVDLDHGGGMADSGHAFKVISIQGIAGLLMGFGWGALIAYRGLNWHVTQSVLLGLAMGVGMVYLLGLMMKGMADLQTSGNIAVERAIGLEGDVYVTVPAAGRGQVRVVVQDNQRIYNAVSGGEELPTGTRIRVVKVNQDNTVVVARA